jgi:dTMP kinase
VFVTFEGIGGAGKTTQTARLARFLSSLGRDVVTTREPGGTHLGEQLRQVLLGTEGIAPWAEATLFAAARAQLVEEVIWPALESGRDVVADRYIDSSLAYQGIGRGLGMDAVLQLNLRSSRGVLPDQTFLLVVDVGEAIQRRDKDDSIERRDSEFLLQVDAAYHELAAVFPQRITMIDAMKPEQEVAKEVRDRLPGLS